MSVLPKERMGEVVPISFGAPQSEPTTSAWQVGGSPASAAAPPSPQMEPVAAPEPVVQTPQEPYREPPRSEEPPVFEISEDILRLFYEEAVAVGLEDGKSQVFAELTVLQERYAAAVEKLRLVGDQLAAQNQGQIIQLSCLIAEKIVRSHLKLNPTDLLSMIQTTIDAQENVGTVDVVCSAGDFEFLQERLVSSEQTETSLVKVNVKVDETLEYGDFRLETNVGAVDGNIADQVAQVSSAIGGVDGV